MKTLYVVARNHMDPSWRRCFTEHFDCKDVNGIVRPYADIEEAQIREYMHFAEEYGVKYHIEQSITVKRFLERNPDERERFEALQKRGLFELAGGGEAVIDYNMTRGESWARDHLYSILYYQKEFQHKATYAICPDTFGLPSQLPQFMRSLGYDAIIVHDRVFKNNLPFWKGLDGTIIVLDPMYRSNPDRFCADCFKLLPCRACHGEGCEVCGGTGIDRTHTMSMADKGENELCFYGTQTPEETLEEFAKGEKDAYFLSVTTEETEVGEALFKRLLDAAPKYDFTVKFLTYEENFERWLPGKVEALRAGTVPADEIDARVEGNPMATGCYTSRIEIKKQNTQLEELLFAAEQMASLAYAEDAYFPYPQKKLQYLWNKMAFLQFHDCITSSHGDASYTELLRVCREVRLGASQIYEDSVKNLLRGKEIHVPAGYRAAVYCNPDTEPTQYVRLTLHETVKNRAGVEVTDAAGNVLPTMDVEMTPTESGSCAGVLVPATVPAFGWQVFFYRLTEEKNTAVERTQTNSIENAYYRVRAEGARIVEIWDKKNNRIAAKENALGLSVSRDCGHPWGRLKPEENHFFLQNSHCETEIFPLYQRMILTGGYSDPQAEIQTLTWKQVLTLRQNEDLLRVDTEIHWNGQNQHIYLNVPLPFDPQEKVTCEVPFGTLTRGTVEPTNMLGTEDEWPSLGFAGASSPDGAYHVAVIKEGLPGTRIRQDCLQISLLRSAYFPDMGYRTNTDCGTHRYSCALYSFAGTFADGHCPQKAASFNAAGRTFCLPQTQTETENEKRIVMQGTFVPFFGSLPQNLRLSAWKRSEDGKDFVLRFYESEGRETALSLPSGVTAIPCNTLEEPSGAPMEGALRFRPFEIATFRVCGVKTCGFGIDKTEKA